MSTAEQLYKLNIAHQHLTDFVEWLIDVELEDSYTSLLEKFERHQDAMFAEEDAKRGRVPDGMVPLIPSDIGTGETNTNSQ